MTAYAMKYKYIFHNLWLAKGHSMAILPSVQHRISRNRFVIAVNCQRVVFSALGLREVALSFGGM